MANIKVLRFVLTILLSLLVTTSCSNNQINEPVSKTQLSLGTVVTVKIYDKATDRVFDEIFNRLREIEDKMTINENKSEVIKINALAGKNYAKVSNDTFYVIEKGKYFSQLSKGRFDITIGPLVKLWNIGTEKARIPSQNEIKEKRKLVNYNSIALNKDEKSVMLKEEGMIIDLGGIAKGFAADEAVKILNKNNINHAIINLGGNIFAYGSKPDGNPWRVGVQNPLSPRGNHIGYVEVINKSVVTSGIYERYFEEDGKKYHHILDPQTGYPVENNLLSVTIITDSSIDADSLSTAAFSLGLEEGKKLIENLTNVDAVFITKDLEIYLTSRLTDNFKLTDSNFKLMK